MSGRAAGGLLNASSTWSGGISSSCDGFSWSGMSTGPNGLAATNIAVSSSWAKADSDQIRSLSSENGTVESSSSSSSSSSSGGLCVSSRPSGSSSSARSFRSQKHGSMSRGGWMCNLAASHQQLGSCGIVRRVDQTGSLPSIPLDKPRGASYQVMQVSLSSSRVAYLETQTTTILQLGNSSRVCGGIFASERAANSLKQHGIHMKGSFLGLPLVLNRAKKTDTSNCSLVLVRALGRSGQDGGSEKTKEMGEALDMQALEGKWHAELSRASTVPDPSEASWEQMGMVFRVVYAIAMYGGLAFAGSVICNFTGVDLWGGFDLSPEVITTGFGYAVPPMMVLLFILEDEIVKNCGPARAIRDVEDEELMDFFVGMSPWQFPFVVAAGAVAEELFFRVSIQGGLAHAFQVSDKGMSETTIGLASLTGVIPMFVPFAHLFAAVLTAALTGSMYYVISSPKDPKYVVAPAIRGPKNHRDIKARVEAWYARRQQKKIYSPLVESLLALYLGLEWMHTGNILAPIITHTLYSLVIVGNGLRRIHDNREKLRQRVNKIAGRQLTSLKGRESGP